MRSQSPTLLPFFIGMAFGCLATWLSMKLLRRRGVLDVPNQRSMHQFPVVRGGGLGLAVGTLAMILNTSTQVVNTLLPVMISAVLLGVVGLVDDFTSLPSLVRLLLQAAVAAILVGTLGFQNSYPNINLVVLWVIGIVFVVGYVNTFNFMDGINGISVVQISLAGISYLYIGLHEGLSSIAIGGAALVAGAIGFAPFNMPVARVFLGDVGSYFAGTFISGIAVLSVCQGVSVVSVAGPLAISAVDVGSTLLKRLRRRAKLLEAHREHIYQRLAMGGWSHLRTALVVGLFIALSSICGMLALSQEGAALPLALAGMFVSSLGYLALPVLQSKIFLGSRGDH